MLGKNKTKKDEDRKKAGGVISNMIRNKINTYKAMDETIGLDPRAKKEYLKLQKLYPSMFE